MAYRRDDIERVRVGRPDPSVPVLVPALGVRLDDCYDMVRPEPMIPVLLALERVHKRP